MIRKHFGATLLVGLAALATGTAHAGETRSEHWAQVAEPAGPMPAVFAAGGALGEAELGGVTGREDIALLSAEATQRNTVANNSVTGNSVTGNIRIDGNAFQNLQGLAVISANSGNNVAINSAMNVTINMTPAQ